MNVWAVGGVLLVFAFAGFMGWREMSGQQLCRRARAPRISEDVRIERSLRREGFDDDAIAYALADVEPELVRAEVSTIGPLTRVAIPRLGVATLGLTRSSAERRARDRVARIVGVESRAVVLDSTTAGGPDQR